MASPQRACVFAIATIGLVALSSAGRADTLPSRDRVVVLEVAAPDPERLALEDTVRELLARLRVRLNLSGLESAPFARVLVELSPSSAVRVRVQSTRDGVTLVDRTMASSASTLVRREAIAHLIQEAIEADLQREQAESSARRAAVESQPQDVRAVEPSPPAPKGEVARRPSSSPVAVDVGVFGAIGPIATGAIASPRLGGSVALGLATPSRPSLALKAAYGVPIERASDQVTASTSLVAMRALVGATFAKFDATAFDAAIGGGADVLRVSPRSETLPVSALTGPHTRVDPIVSGVLSARFEVVSSVVFFAAAAVDVDFADRSYVVLRGSEREEVLAPWRVRPTLEFGFGFSPKGPPIFAAASRVEEAKP